jgi:sec-independent protein translocase protein TatC
MASDTPDGESLAEGTLISHLLELRTRLMRAAIAVAVAATPCLWFQNELFTLIAQPLLASLPKGATMISTSVTAPFMAPFKLALYVALFLAMPVVLYQIWAFVAPGLYKHERRFAVPLLISSVLLFYVGVTFAYLFVFPVMFAFFAATTPVGVQMMTDITQYLDFVLVLFLAFGVAFEMPVAIVLLVWAGLVKLDTLRNNRGYVILGIFIVAAILTPPDAVSQCMMAVPMYLLYEFGLVMARILAKAKIEQRAKEEAEERAREQAEA